MKKIFVLILCISIFTSMINFADANYSSQSAINYLASHNNSAWTVMALSAAGQAPSTEHLEEFNYLSAIQYAAPILAVTSRGIDPRDFAGQNLIDGLLSFRKNGQIGDESLVNDDIFSILSLIAAGFPISDSLIVELKDFVLSKQNTDGGWGYAINGDSDTNTTAVAIIALINSGVSSFDQRVVSAINYLKFAQNSDGGFAYDPNSAYGRESDSSSTAWVKWVITSLSQTDDQWTKDNKTPSDYLVSTQTPDGFFAYQSGGSEDSFTPIATSYATIALSGKTLPIQKINPILNQYLVRIEGSSETLCKTKTSGNNALTVLINAAQSCNLTYHISETSFGPYLDEINEDKAVGMKGWMYLVNYQAPSVGAADYVLKKDDEILWFFGDYDWQPIKIEINPTEWVESAQTTATVTVYNSSSWQPLSDAIIKIGASVFLTDDNGQALIKNVPGYYQVFAEKDGGIRSDKVLVKIGSPDSSIVDLTINVPAGAVLGEEEDDNSSIAFYLSSDRIDFGDFKLNSRLDKPLTITNSSNIAANFYSEVKGDEIFSLYLNLDGKSWRNFQVQLQTQQAQEILVRLQIPKIYSITAGKKTGQLIIWAQKAN